MATPSNQQLRVPDDSCSWEERVQFYLALCRHDFGLWHLNWHEQFRQDEIQQRLIQLVDKGESEFPPQTSSDECHLCTWKYPAYDAATIAQAKMNKRTAVIYDVLYDEFKGPRPLHHPERIVVPSYTKQFRAHAPCYRSLCKHWQSHRRHYLDILMPMYRDSLPAFVQSDAVGLPSAIVQFVLLPFLIEYS